MLSSSILLPLATNVAFKWEFATSQLMYARQYENHLEVSYNIEMLAGILEG